MRWPNFNAMTNASSQTHQKTLMPEMPYARKNKSHIMLFTKVYGVIVAD